MAPGGMLPVLKDVAGDPDFMRDPAGVFNVYGHEKVQGIISGLERTESFAGTASGGVEKAALVFAEKIIPQMIHDAVFNGVAPETAVRRAQEEIRNALK
jgi:multiple sugar transport system substrate-binding protein